MTTPTTTKLPVLHREATIEAVEGSENTYRAIYSTGAAVRRMDYEDGPYSEELSLQPGHVRTQRLDNGIVPILLDHHQSVRSQFGVIDKHWIEGGKGYVEFRMETGTPDADAIRNKLDQKIVRTVSVGYRVHRYQKIVGAAGSIPVLRAVDWEPMELSLVSIPADAGAVIRSDGETQDCVIETEIAVPAAETTLTSERSDPMTLPVITDNAADIAARAAELENVRAAAALEARTEERTRVSGITEAVRKAKLDTAFADKLVADGKTLDEARAAILDKLATADEGTEFRSAATVGHSFDDPTVVRAAIVNAFAHKMNPSIKLEGKANELRSYTMLEAFCELEQARGHKVRFNKEELSKRALQGTSDFPVILADAAHRVVLADYQAANPSYKAIARQRNFTDFRPHYVLRSGEFPALQDLSQHGEIKSASLSDANTESVQLKTRAIKLGITRQLLINDSLGIIDDMIGKSGRRIAAQENQLAWAVLKANRTMSDGKALFHADHGNLHATVVATPTLAALSAARAAMRKQRSDGIPLNLAAKYLVVGTDDETEAEKLMTAILATATGDVNIWSNKLQIISDAELDDHASWYLATSPADAEVLVYGYLGGASGPSVEAKEGWDVDGSELRVIQDFGVDAVGEKGVYKFRKA